MAAAGGKVAADATITVEQRAEVAYLYKRLAQHWGWPLPETFIADRETIKGDIESALVCLRALVADQCEPLRNPP
jgi:hypothetical protein